MRIFVSVAVLLTLCTPLPSQEKPSTLKGIVTREDGTGLRAAYVFLRDYQAGTQWEMHTEADGGFSFVVDPGCYDIFVSQAVFLPFSNRLCVQAESRSTFRLKLRADPHPRLRLD
ncbi:MAG: carboxypeptidase-like regulatory domain-containing protein [Candidatus Sulfotelmatobacter sp.]